MIRTKSIILPKELDHIYFMPIGDFHVGDPAGLGGSSAEGKHATKKFRDMISWIKNKECAYTFLMGDLFDTALKNSKSNIHKQDYNIDTAKDFLTDELRPIKDKILGCIDGNHEERMIREVGCSPVKDLSKFIGIEYFPNWCAYLYLSVGDNKDFKNDKHRPYIYTAFMHHMRGGGATPGGKINRLKKLKAMVLADLYCGAHVHIKATFKEKYIIPDIRAKKLVQQQQTYVATGSFMGYAAYSVEGMYEKPATGAVRIRLNGEPTKGKDIHASI